MSEAQNTQVVKDAYAAFQRGDINTILGLLDEEIVWQAVKGTEGVVPTAGVRHGRAGVAEFFKQLGEAVAFDAFEPREFVAQGDTVVAIGYYRGKAKPTGRPMSSDWVMVFNFRGAKIARFREFTDSAAIVRAFSADAPV
jgi:ketosteroid isomerase-like protein